MGQAATDSFADRPVIGISGWLEKIQWGNILDEYVAFAENSFVEKLAAVGADAVIIPAQPHVPADFVRGLDGLVIVGGPDVQSPRFVSVHTQPPRPEVGRRDAVELLLSEIALEDEIPILGVCRGCQILNVIAGGTLVPEVKDRFEGIIHTYWDPEAKERADFARHQVVAEPESPIGRALGTNFEVLSSHHQAVDRLAPRFLVAAQAEDGLLEAFYDPEHPFAVGIQWHPEAEERPVNPLFAALVDAARARRAARIA